MKERGSTCSFFLSKIACLYDSAFFQQDPNTDMWLIPRHLTSVCFVDLSCDHLELLHELCCLCLVLRDLFLECIQYLHCDLIIENPCKLFLVLCHICFGFICLCDDLGYSLLEQFNLSLVLLFLCLHSYELCLQFLHVLFSFDAFRDRHCLLPLLEVLDSFTYPLSFLVPLLDLLILL